MLKEVDEAVAVTRWHLADVRFNREAAGNAPGLATLHQRHSFARAIVLLHGSLHIVVHKRAPLGRFDCPVACSQARDGGWGRRSCRRYMKFQWRTSCASTCTWTSDCLSRTVARSSVYLYWPLNMRPRHRA